MTSFCPISLDICRTRGDDRPFSIVLKQLSDGTVIDITGRTYILTVNSEDEPVDDTNQKFQLAGVVAVGTDGRVTFSPDVPARDLVVGEYFFDIQETATGTIKTIAKGQWDVLQDITK